MIIMQNIPSVIWSTINVPWIRRCSQNANLNLESIKFSVKQKKNAFADPLTILLSIGAKMKYSSSK